MVSSSGDGGCFWCESAPDGTGDQTGFTELCLALWSESRPLLLVPDGYYGTPGCLEARGCAYGPGPDRIVGSMFFLRPLVGGRGVALVVYNLCHCVAALLLLVLWAAYRAVPEPVVLRRMGCLSVRSDSPLVRWRGGDFRQSRRTCSDTPTCHMSSRAGVGRSI